LDNVDFVVPAGSLTALLGPSGSGKSTLLRAIAGLVPRLRGAIRFDGEAIDGLPTHERIARGLVLVPEGRMVFPFLSVEDNLRLGAFTPKARARAEATLARVYAMFPRLPERRRQMAGSLSGGEQQMLALGRGLMSLPRLLMLDEPSLGLAPILVQEVMQRVATIRSEGVTVLIVEQNVHQTLKLADRGYVLENGRLTLQGTAAELAATDEVRRAYLGL